ncbi:MAG: hypothetical protein ACOX7K_03505 [Oscillospiraceae bacterium]|jgi:hypothetical protein
MIHQPKKDPKIQKLLSAATVLAVLLMIPIYLIVSRWSKTVAGIDMFYIFLYGFMTVILYFFPQLLFFQNIRIDDSNVTVSRAGLLPDRLVFAKQDVAYCRLDRKDGTPLTLQSEDPQVKDGCAVAFVLKDGTKVTSDRIYFDLDAFDAFRQALPNLIAPGESKEYKTSSKHAVPIQYTRHLEIPLGGIILIFLGYVFYSIAF